MIERTSTKAFTKIPPGRWSFKVVGKPEKIQAGKTTARIWKLLPDIPSISEPIEYKLLPWQSKELLLAVGGKLENEEVVWDDENVDGVLFTAQAEYVDGTTINPRTGKPYRNLVLKDIEPEIQF